MSKIARCIEHYTDNKLESIECLDEYDEHIFDALWDPREPQTLENRAKFKDWVVSMLKRKGYELDD